MSEVRKSIASAVGSMTGVLSLDTAQSKHLLALLRRSAASGIDEPECMGWFFTRVPEDIQNSGGNLNKAEKAIYLAISVFAVCRKGDNPEQSMVSAMKRAGIDRSKLEGIEAAASFEDLKMPLYLLAKHITSKGQGFSYTALALDLYDIQFDKMKTVRKWEREYAMKGVTNDEK